MCKASIICGAFVLAAPYIGLYPRPVSGGVTQAPDRFIVACQAGEHPWEGARRSEYVSDAAQRAFVFDPYPNLRRLPELCRARCPSSMYVNPDVLSAAADHELHLIGVYEGPELDATPDGKPVVTSIVVKVHPTASPVVLFLMSHENVVWDVKPDSNAVIDKLYYSGHGNAVVHVAGKLGANVEPAGKIAIDEMRGSESVESMNALAAIREITGHPVTSFQGAYRGERFDVPFYHDASVVREIVAAHRHNLRARVEDAQGSYYLIEDDRIVGKGMARARQGRIPVRLKGSLDAVTFSEVDGSFYGITSHGFYRVAPDGSLHEVKPPAEYPRLSWLGGVAYDASMKRVVVATSWHTGFHHTFDPLTQEWRIFPVAKTSGGLVALAYNSEDGLLYGLGHSGAIQVLSSTMDVRHSIALRHPEALPNRSRDAALQMAAMGTSLVVHIATRRFWRQQDELPPRLRRFTRHQAYVVRLPSGEMSILRGSERIHRIDADDGKSASDGENPQPVAEARRREAAPERSGSASTPRSSSVRERLRELREQRRRANKARGQLPSSPLVDPPDN